MLMLSIPLKNFFPVPLAIFRQQLHGLIRQPDIPDRALRLRCVLINPRLILLSPPSAGNCPPGSQESSCAVLPAAFPPILRRRAAAVRSIRPITGYKPPAYRFRPARIRAKHPFNISVSTTPSALKAVASTVKLPPYPVR